MINFCPLSYYRFFNFTEIKIDRPTLQKLDEFLVHETSLNYDDLVIVTGSVPNLMVGGTNFIKIHQIGTAR